MCSWDALRNLRDRTGETTQLVVMTDNKCLILEQCVSDQPIKFQAKWVRALLFVSANLFLLIYR